MTEMKDGGNPRLFAVKLNVMLGLVTLDCVINGFADHLWAPSQLTLNIVLGVLPIVVHLLMVLNFFMLLWHTFLLRYGLLLELWTEFRGDLLLSVGRFGILLGARLPRLIAALDETPADQYWNDPFHHAMFFIHNITSVAHGVWILRRSFGLARARYFKPQLWHKQRRAGNVRRIGA